MIEFRTGYHSLLLQEVHVDIQCSHVLNTKVALEESMEDSPKLDAR